MDLQTLDLDLEVKVEDVRPDGWFSGFLAYYNNVDRKRDKIIPGAFDKSLKAKPASKVRLLWMHDAWEPIGKFLSLTETPKGLKFEAKLTLGVARANDVHALLLDTAVDTMSIGYNADPAKQGFDREKDVRELKEIDLWEGSVVTFPANEKCVITGVKHTAELLAELKAATTLRELEFVLRDAGLSRSFATYVAERHRFDHPRDAEKAAGPDEAQEFAALLNVIRETTQKIKV